MANQKTSWRWLASSLLLVCVALFLYAGARPDGLTHIYFFDVGQGDASLVRSSTNQTILIDGGPAGSVEDDLARVLGPGHSRIDLVILTHPHADHAGGLLDVVSQYDVGEFWVNGSEYDTKTYRALLDSLEGHGIPVRVITSPHQARVGDVELTVLHPDTVVPSPADENTISLVAVVRVGNFRALFTGDIDQASEADILSRGSLPDADVIKIPHHGSATSSSQPFVTAADPEVGVVMVGADNDYGHPDSSVVSLYESLGVELWRTDIDGTIEVVTDGMSYAVR